jgi:hypothetical protein
MTVKLLITFNIITDLSEGTEYEDMYYYLRNVQSFNFVSCRIIMHNISLLLLILLVVSKVSLKHLEVCTVI